MTCGLCVLSVSRVYVARSESRVHAKQRSTLGKSAMDDLQQREALLLDAAEVLCAAVRTHAACCR